ncbi:hypothetical protein E2C01_075928 [Portunus trituberculatus]|uniref:Uncharacterized protein n=1 Tax=Portunus trituberculatus TaxID=210409 RepID=A0A5B7I7F1_PORTR|nr:hypothetical protein [Portunus trituberculatus]
MLRRRSCGAVRERRCAGGSVGRVEAMPKLFHAVGEELGRGSKEGWGVEENWCLDASTDYEETKACYHHNSLQHQD